MTTDMLSQSTVLWALLALQIVMGGFDIVVHHEITEQLAWKPNAGQELRLHAARNALYAVLFGGLAVLQPTGWWAVLLIAILIVEIVITLWDFVEEDRTRKLPPTERVLHTLLAINYGAILAMVLPVLAAWAASATVLVPVWYGFGSVILAIAGIGCLAFAVRDVATSRRADRLTTPPLPNLAPMISGRKRVLVTGATGYVGSRLVAALAKDGHDVIALVRDPARAGHLATPLPLITRLDQIPATSRIDAVVHLAGTPVADWPWTLPRRLSILRSRIKIARQIQAWIAARPAELRPTVQVSASAIGFYGERGEETVHEADGPGSGFASRSCQAVERETGKVRALGVRTVSLRIGLVMSRQGGALARMIPAFDLALGGPLGSGRQWMSWIWLDDLVRLIGHAIGNPDVDGAINATAPQAIRNGDFACAVGAALNRPAVIPVPSLLLTTALGEMGESLLLGSVRVYPAKAMATGFAFEAPAFADMLAREFGMLAKEPGSADQPTAMLSISRVLPSQAAIRMRNGGAVGSDTSATSASVAASRTAT
jgi:uncharacterized protein (TIGR01777 family)